MRKVTLTYTTALLICCTSHLSAREIVTQPSTPQSVPTQTAQSGYPQLTPEESDKFTMEMQKAIEKEQKRVNQLAERATSQQLLPTWSSKVELKQAMTMLEVKKTLMNNFKGSEAIRSPLVREKLLKLLNQDNIAISDLADLQNLTLHEKERIQSYNQEQKTNKLF